LVEVHLHDKDRSVRGTVVEVAKAKGDKGWNRRYEQQPYYRWDNANGSMLSPQGRYLVLEADGSREYIDIGQIARLSVKDAGKTVKRRQPVLLLEAQGAGPEADAKQEIAVSISYLSKGLSWAPSYRVNLKDSEHLSIEQQAVVRNELMDVDAAEIYLISGFPSMQFSHVVSPLSPNTTWAAFFQQLSQQPGAMAGAMSNMVQQVAFNGRSDSAEMDIPVAPNGEGVDMHYQPIGRKSLAEGDAMSVSVASAEAEYERIVEWMVPDGRDANGAYAGRQDPEKYEDAWDAIRFNNPFNFPMTTAPAMILQEGRFSGQRQSFWVSAGEQTTLRITKSLSIRTRASENEVAAERDLVAIGGWKYRKVTVKGELSVRNHRNEDVKLVIKRQFSGDLVRADREPKSELLVEGVYSVNRRNELTWTVPMKAGEALTLTYEYSVLVRQ
jgi:hypothetical protein